MRLVYLSIYIMVISLLASACSRSVYSDKVDGANFEAFKTYAWLPNGKDTTDEGSSSVFDNEITYENVRKAADKEMQRKGYTLDVTNPDLVLLAHLNFENIQEIASIPLYSSYSYYYPGFYTGVWNPGFYGGYYNVPYVYGSGISQISYTQGTVVIDVIERKNSRLIWRGWSDKRIDDYKDVRGLYARVEDIFKRYPVKTRRR